MAGFVLDDDNGQLHTHSLEDIENLVQKGQIDYPIISKVDIKDRRKGDVATNGLMLIQTTWFLLQCAAHGTQHLSLTKLELATAAFAPLNIVIYVLWWDKPLNVQCPVGVRKKHVCSQGGGGEVASGKKETGQDDSQQRSKAVAEWQGEHMTFANGVRDWWSRLWRWWSWSNVWEAVEMVFEMVSGPFDVMIVEDEDDDTFFVGKNEYSDRRVKSFVGAVVVSMVFGAIHCIGWLLSFPSHTEQHLWRISSVAITGVPLIIAVIRLFSEYSESPSSPSFCYHQFFTSFPVLHCWLWLSCFTVTSTLNSANHAMDYFYTTCLGYIFVFVRLCCNNIIHSYHHFAYIC
jgi:hypothetical protein